MPLRFRFTAACARTVPLRPTHPPRQFRFATRDDPLRSPQADLSQHMLRHSGSLAAHASPRRISRGTCFAKADLSQHMLRQGGSLATRQAAGIRRTEFRNRALFSRVDPGRSAPTPSRDAAPAAPAPRATARSRASRVRRRGRSNGGRCGPRPCRSECRRAGLRCEPDSAWQPRSRPSTHRAPSARPPRSRDR